MRSILIMCLVLLRLAGMAQQPLLVTNNYATPYDLAGILAREGEFISINAPISSVVWNGTSSGGGQYLGGPIVPIGKAVFVQGGLVGSDVKSRLQIASGQLQNFGNPPQVFQIAHIPLGGGTVSLPASGWMMPGSNGGEIRIQRVFGKDSLTAAHDYFFGWYGTSITADLNFSAKKLALWIGTSISAGTGPTDTQNMFAFLTRNYLRDSLNYDVRLVNKAMSGSTSTQTETYRLRGRYDVFSPNLVFYEHGANDAGQSIPTATTISNIDKMVRMKQAKWPNALFIILAPSVNGNSTTETAQVALRTAIANYVSGLGDAKVKYIPATGSAWTQATAGTYTTDLTHPNDSGNRRIYWAIRDALVTYTLP